MKIFVSHGEIVDKLTILSIKKDCITDPVKQESILKEYDYLLNIVENELQIPTNSSEYLDLWAVNMRIWWCEDKLRVKDLDDKKYLRYSKQSHLFNEIRYQLKQVINEKYESNFKEQKSYG